MSRTKYVLYNESLKDDIIIETQVLVKCELVSAQAYLLGMVVPMLTFFFLRITK